MSLPKTATMEDQDLLGMFQEGGKKRNEAFEYIYRNWKKRACSILRSKGIQDADVKDIAHIAFIIFDRKMRNEDFELTGSLESYFISISVNQAIVFFNKNKRTDLTDEEEKLYSKEGTEMNIPFFLEKCKKLINLVGFKRKTFGSLIDLLPSCVVIFSLNSYGYSRQKCLA